MSLPSDGSEIRAENRIHAPSCRAFLYDNNGQLIRDFGELLPESISALSLVGLIEPGNLRDFLETVRRAAPGSEARIDIDCEGSAGHILLRGCRIAGAILVFATSTSSSAALQAHRPADISNEMFAAVHDLNNPISSIISSCEYFTEYSQESLDAVHKEMIGGIESAARTLLQLSGKIASLCKVGAPFAAGEPGRKGISPNRVGRAGA